MQNENKFQVVILAAGHGKRMKSELPKVLLPVNGKPMVEHLVNSVIKSEVCEKPLVVVSKNGLVKEALGDKCDYVVQEEQLGTGHAVLTTAPLLEGKVENILVLNGDMPFTSPETIKKMCSTHQESGKNMTIGTADVGDFEGWKNAFFTFGRIVRDDEGNLVRIAYGKNLADKELKITEVDPAYSCYKTSWLWPHLRSLKNENDHKEYYLTDLVKVAFEEKNPPATVDVPSEECLGANRKEDLEILKNLRS
jgi:bifunctional UDP-N-acetylglucosamine pyrophosphorylase/glucosamine-1-phosphate N-acetyltransferase